MPTQLATPTPTPARLSVPTLDERRAAIDLEMLGIENIGAYWRGKERTRELDDQAVLLLCEFASNIFDHFEACPVTAARFTPELRDILSKLAFIHRERLANLPPPPPPRKSATRDPRKRPPPEPVVVATVEPHKDVSNDGGVARSYARRAPLATQPYQRSARPTARKQKKVEDVEDVPEAIAASVRAAQDDERNQLDTASITKVVTPSLDELCALFSSTTLDTSAPTAAAAKNTPSDPAPAPHLSTPVSTRTFATPPAPITSRVRGKSAPARANPLDRSGRRRGKTAQL